MRILLALLIAFTVSSYAVIPDKFYKSEDGSTFFIESEQKFTWYEAWQQCALKDMSLVTIDSIGKHQQIDRLIRKIFPVCPSLWLAANDFIANKNFTWITTGQSFDFTNWGPTQPNADVNEHCVFILANTWEWHDVTCLAKSGFICEENLRRQIPEEDKKSIMDPKKCCENKPQEHSKYESIIFNRK